MTTSHSKTKRPKWSITTQFWAAVSIAVLSSVAVFLLSKKNIWNELEIIVSVLSIFTFIYFLVLFYHGVRFDRNEVYSITWKPFNFEGWADTVGYGVDTGGIFTSAGAEAGPLGCLVGLLLDILVSILLIVLVAVLLWLGFNVLTTGIMIVMIPLYFLFRRSLRVAVVRARACHGDLKKSTIYALGATVVNMAWLYLIIFAGHHISFWLKSKR